MMNALLLSSGLPQNLLGEAILSANYILNRIPHKKTNKSPYELWKGRRPSYKYLKVWGCLAKVAVPIPKKVKIGPKAVDCVFIRYAHNSSSYRSFLICMSILLSSQGMHLSLKMYFLTNPHRSRTQVKELMILNWQ